MDNFNMPINNQQQPEKARKFFSVPKIIFAIFALIILVELIYTIRTLSLPLPTLSVLKNNTQKAVAKISLTASKSNFNVSDIIPVSVIIDSGSHQISGADLIVQYDPKVLEVTPADLIKGKIFDQYPLAAVDASKGIVSISGVSSPKSNFNGTGQFALINLKAKTKGKTSLTVNFKKGSTISSNLAEIATATNVLEQVDNLELNIQ